MLVFGFMAVTNLMLVAASSNRVANQGTAAVNSANPRDGDDPGQNVRRPGPPRRPELVANHAAKACTDSDLTFADWHCSDTVPGFGRVHMHW